MKTQRTVLKLESTINELEKIKSYALKVEAHFENDITRAHPQHKDSLRNLLHYIGLRHFDIRALQDDLAQLGLSSLGRSECHVMATLDSVLRQLYSMIEKPFNESTSYLNFHASNQLFENNIRILFGSPPKKRFTHIMVTLPSEAATNRKLIEEMVDAGMDCARINCAHDTPDIWEKMIGNVRDVGHQKKKQIKVFMDLAGPKIRTKLITSKKEEERPLVLFKKDIVNIIDDISAKGSVDQGKVITCTIPEILSDVKAGESVIFNDGKISGEAIEVGSGGIKVIIKRAKEKGSKLRSDKGINFPESKLSIAGLTKYDREVLPFVVKNADAVNMSFVRSPEDVEELLDSLEALKATNLAVVLKIETKQAFEKLPLILIKSMKHYPLGLMIARGDLAIDAGWIRMAEIQEEILWFSEAAHLPDIWATQVLENLAQKGLPSRAEITDAAMSQRADCVMLNKGPHIVEAIKTLDTILSKMQEHQHKKFSMLRRLSISEILNKHLKTAAEEH